MPQLKWVPLTCQFYESVSPWPPSVVGVQQLSTDWLSHSWGPGLSAQGAVLHTIVVHRDQARLPLMPRSHQQCTRHMLHRPHHQRSQSRQAATVPTAFLTLPRTGAPHVVVPALGGLPPLLLTFLFLPCISDCGLLNQAGETRTAFEVYTAQSPPAAVYSHHSTRYSYPPLRPATAQTSHGWVRTTAGRS